MAYPYYPTQYSMQPNAFQNVGNVNPTQMNVGQPMQQPVQQPIQQMQNGGYVVVQNEEEVRRYPVAHGNLVTFRIENQPIVIEKSMGFSQFDTPHYEKYKLIKEDMEISETPKPDYILKSDYETSQKEILSLIDDLKKQISDMEKKPTRKKEVEA